MNLARDAEAGLRGLASIGHILVTVVEVADAVGKLARSIETRGVCVGDVADAAAGAAVVWIRVEVNTGSRAALVGARARLLRVASRDALSPIHRIAADRSERAVGVCEATLARVGGGIAEGRQDDPSVVRSTDPGL